MRPLFCIFMHPHQLMDAKKKKKKIKAKPLSGKRLFSFSFV